MCGQIALLLLATASMLKADQIQNVISDEYNHTSYPIRVPRAPSEYCNLRCGDAHTLCKYPDTKPGKSCIGHKNIDLTPNQKQFILSYHNWKRNEVARGRYRPQPKASNMYELVWDRELARIAKRWVDQCIFQHDECRIVDRYPIVGQNIAIRWNNLNRGVDGELKYLCDEWFDEIKDFSSSDIDSFQETKNFEPETQHYTQFVWAKTRRIGCGISVRTTEGITSYFLACNYAPGGNIVGKSVYKIGKPCSECPAESDCSEYYPGLCAFGGTKRVPRLASLMRDGPSKGSVLQNYSVMMTLLSIFVVILNFVL